MKVVCLALFATTVIQRKMRDCSDPPLPSTNLDTNGHPAVKVHDGIV